MLTIHNDILCAADGGNISIVTLLDFISTFDPIDHSILIELLSRAFGISGTAGLSY